MKFLRIITIIAFLFITINHAKTIYNQPKISPIQQIPIKKSTSTQSFSSPINAKENTFKITLEKIRNMNSNLVVSENLLNPTFFSFILETSIKANLNPTLVNILLSSAGLLHLSLTNNNEIDKELLKNIENQTEDILTTYIETYISNNEM